MPAQTFKEYSDRFDLAHLALNGGWDLDTARRMGFRVTVRGEFVKALSPELSMLQPAPRNKELFELRIGDAFGRQYDPSQWGWPNGRPNQGYGNWLAGKPRIPDPTRPEYDPPHWPELRPRATLPAWKPY